MEKELIEPLINVPVKVKLNTGFILSGKITKISGEHVVFSTLQKTSIIHFSEFKEIIPL